MRNSVVLLVIINSILLGCLAAPRLEGIYTGTFKGALDGKDPTKNGLVNFEIKDNQVTGSFETNSGRSINFNGVLKGTDLQLTADPRSGCTVTGSFSQSVTFEVGKPPSPGFSGTLKCSDFTASWTAGALISVKPPEGLPEKELPPEEPVREALPEVEQNRTYRGEITGSGTVITRDDPVLDIYDTDQFGRIIPETKRRVTIAMTERGTVDFQLAFDVTFYPPPPGNGYVSQSSFTGLLTYSGESSISNCGAQPFKDSGKYNVRGTAKLNLLTQEITISIDKTREGRLLLAKCAPAELKGDVINYADGSLVDIGILPMDILSHEIKFGSKGGTVEISGKRDAWDMAATGGLARGSCDIPATAISRIGAEEVREVFCGDYEWSGTAQLTPVR